MPVISIIFYLLSHVFYHSIQAQISILELDLICCLKMLSFWIILEFCRRVNESNESE